VAEISFAVEGIPAPQGSKKHVGNGVMVEVSKRVAPWRKAVAKAASRAMIASPDFCVLLPGPVAVEAVFYFARPKSHYRTGRYSHLLRDDAPRHHTGNPDGDKCARSTLDGLQGTAFLNDSQVTDLHALKRYALRGQQPGALITIREIWEQEP
jgi:Holliday junction resolvase RusA-like endonuclease